MCYDAFINYGEFEIWFYFIYVGENVWCFIFVGWRFVRKWFMGDYYEWGFEIFAWEEFYLMYRNLIGNIRTETMCPFIFLSISLLDEIKIEGHIVSVMYYI